MKRTGLIVCFLFLSVLLMPGEETRLLNTLLDQLDKELELRHTYEQNRLQRINALKSVLHYQDLPAEQRYSFYQQLIDEYKAFHFDSTIYYIEESARLAAALNHKKYTEQSLIRRGLIFATSGNFLESSDILYKDLDPETLSFSVTLLLRGPSTVGLGAGRVF